ncbi:MAG TPA: FAD-dependent oxidoreductase, partial [bacterium]|nr:FAD-dependent oxidoreductase [bacterium]
MADTTSRIIIIGSSAAGLSAAQEARKTSPEATITLISEEPHLPYHRPSLTEYIGDESVERRPQFLLQPAGWFAAQRIDLRRGIRAAGIDRQSRQVLLVSGELLPFDRLVLAVGAQPFVPMADALSRENVFAVRTLDDARRVAQCADRSH